MSAFLATGKEIKMDIERASVLVVGGGMVGLSAAVFLARHGVPTVLVERHAGSSLHPRAMGFTTRTMELYRAVGLGSEIPQIPPGFSRPRRVKVESVAGQWAAGDVAWTPDALEATAEGSSETREFSICTGAAIPQDRLEPIIRAKAIGLGADVRLSTTLLSFEQDARGVTVFLRRRDGHEYSLRVDYLIAADGHSSAIREALGIGRDGRGVLRTVRSVLFRAPLDQYLESGVSQFEIEQSDFKAMLTTYRDGRWLLMFSDDQERDESSLKAMVVKAVGRSDLEIEIITTGRWELSALIADRFASGRIFLAGDAAHTLPPSRGGYGANTGIEDAHNLAWKAASVLSGSSAPGLLDTYDEERRPIAWLRHRQIFARPDYAQFALPADKDVPIIDDDAMELGQLYQSAAVCNAGQDLPAALRPDQWSGQPGTRAPHEWVISGGARVSTLDLVQPEWVLLTQDQRWRAAAEQASDQTGIKLKCELVDGAAEMRPQKSGNPLDLPIERIVAEVAGKSVLDTLLPQVTGHARYETFKTMSLRQLQPMSQGQISDEALASVQSELGAILDCATLLDPVDPEAFAKAFGIGCEGCSLIRPDGFVAWRSIDFPRMQFANLLTSSARSLSRDPRCRPP
ncbi:FAD-dependent oxidoreductase [Martelella soudanensis]|uniref:FAD-dependent oxidoreductase n=1 Tax=Martelella sp. NC18 TaxID=2740297 RepID=UPI001AEF03B9|nr:FAD-dependent oxidoreductase [Martelella sp. NC18]